VWVLELELELEKVGLGLLAQSQTSRGAPQTQNCGQWKKVKTKEGSWNFCDSHMMGAILFSSILSFPFSSLTSQNTCESTINSF
jgi:hypothetical protein